jgi:hypothetical protein
MSPSTRKWMAAAVLAALLSGSQLIPATALADPEVPPQPQLDAPPQNQGVLHNIIYRARVDGVSRGATITYQAEGDRRQTANPTMVPGRTFEANTVLPGSKVASMKVSIDWPYSANLHCEILVDDQVVAQADDFIAPRFMPARDDPDYGALTCEAPVTPDAIPAAPMEPAAPVAPAAPADPGAPA